ncbi:hypothetical protein [Methylocapsa sp. S129]|uniref:hypothetical protein n=1 Tax=Methylocapsa sp. S129 TaxID=1641869 RepID=UPI00131E601E|nr:hypothetical protein [Methylocapsa sp. S129]
MLSEVLTSLKEVKLQLQRQLAQQPEYRALLVVDRAAAQLAEILGPQDPPAAVPSAGAVEDAPPPPAAAEPVNAVSQDEYRVQDAPVETAAAIEEPAVAPSSLAQLENRIADAPAPAQAPTEEPVKAAPHPIDRFLSSSAPSAAPVAKAPEPRGYLPFVGAPRLVKNSRF